MLEEESQFNKLLREVEDLENYYMVLHEFTELRDIDDNRAIALAKSKAYGEIQDKLEDIVGRYKTDDE